MYSRTGSCILGVFARCTARGCGYFYSGPKSTRKYLYSLFWNHIVRKTKSLHVLTPCIQKPENERAVPDRATRRHVVIIVPIISKQRNLGLITVLRHHMMKALKSNKVELSSRMSSRDPVIRIFDFRPPGVSRALPRWHVGSGFRHFGQFRSISDWGEENLAKVSGGICPDGCPLEIA